MNIKELKIATSKELISLVDVHSIHFGMMAGSSSCVGSAIEDDRIYVFAKSGNLVFDMNDVKQISMIIEQSTNKNKPLLLSSFGEEEDYDGAL